MSAKRNIVKRRIGFITGNVNSYARILNGPTQLDKIKSYNEVAASIALIRKERDERSEVAKAKKKQDEIDKAIKKAEKERKDAEECECGAPVCRADVEKGIEHVLSLKNKETKDILRVHFCITSAFVNGAEKTLYKFLLVEAEIEIRCSMHINLKNKDDEESVESVGEPHEVAEM